MVLSARFPPHNSCTHITDSYKHPSFHLVLINITAHYIPQRRRGKRDITKMKRRKKEIHINPT
jgi:hypothetical protein